MADTLIADIRELLEEVVVSELRGIAVKLDGIQTSLERMNRSMDERRTADSLRE